MKNCRNIPQEAYFVESKSTASDIILGNDMNSPMTTFPRLHRMFLLVLWLAVAGIFAAPLRAQDVKVSTGGGDAEKAKADKELADKLPPEQAAAYLKSRAAWSTTGETLQCLAALALPIGIVAIVLTFRHRRQKLAHETMRLMIEKGLPVPPELINPPPPVKPPKNDLRRGLIWLALGGGFMILWPHCSPWRQWCLPSAVLSGRSLPGHSKSGRDCRAKTLAAARV
jgi:hypothetical protein